MVIENSFWKVYYHLFPNGKFYIGVTSEPTIYKRFKNGEGYNTQLVYKAIQKYGWDNIQHGIIANNLTKQEAKNFEKLLIKKLNCFIPNGYNATYGGEGTNYYDYEEIKNKFLEGYTQKEIQNFFNCSSWVTNKVFTSLNEKENQEYRNQLEKRRSFKILEDYKNNLTYEEIASKNNCCIFTVRNVIAKYFSEEERKRAFVKNTKFKIKKIALIDDFDNVIKIFKSARAAAKELGCDHKYILNICNNKPGYKSCKGYRFKFMEV